MKTNCTRFLFVVVFIYLLVFLVSFRASAQPDYDFSNGSLMSGTDLTVGATYRFTTVKPGVDAIVTITNITNGLTLNSVDGPSGFKEALQPVIQVPAGVSAYAELLITFVTAGTTTPQTMLEVPLTCIDVDGRMIGGAPINEFDMVRKSTGIYVDYGLLGGELNISYDPNWIIGTNTGTIDYPAVDTVAKQAMFSTVSSNISSIVVRVGADNKTSSSQQRLRSIYFKKFTYMHSFLAKSPLVSFRGWEKNENVELNWQLEQNNTIQTIIIEKANGSAYNAIGQYFLNAGNGKIENFKYTDSKLSTGNNIYRLKMISMNGEVSYSNVLSFRSSTKDNGNFKVYPSAIQTAATVNVKANKSGTAILELVDYAGRIVKKQQITVQEGMNNIAVNNLSELMAGNYVAVLKIDNNIYNQKIMKQ